MRRPVRARHAIVAALVVLALVNSCAGDDGGAGGPTTTVAVPDDPAEDDMLHDPSESDPDEVPDVVDELEGPVDPDDPDEGSVADPAPGEAVDDDPPDETDGGVPRPGSAWQRVDGDPRVFGAVPPVVTALGTGVDRVIAVGRTRDGSRALLLWTSADGTTWSVLDGAAAFGASGESVEIRQVIARGNGFVAIGIEALGPAPTVSESDDEGDVPDLEVGGEGSADAGDQADAAPAAGTIGRVRGAVWLSADGSVWERVVEGAGLLDEVGSVFLNAVSTGGPGLIAVGGVDAGDDRHGAVWVSNDGSGWLRVPHDPEVFGDVGRTSIEDIAVTATRSVAVGVAPGIGRETRGAVWVSDDGVGWRPVPHDTTVFGGVGTSVRMNAVTEGGPGFVAVGSERVPADGSLRFEAAVWWSADGEVWERVDPSEPAIASDGSQVLWDVVTLEDRVIAVGGDSGVGVVWWSDDGRSWQRVANEGAMFGEDGATQLQHLVVLGGSLVAAGVSDEFVPIWSSEPG